MGEVWYTLPMATRLKQSALERTFETYWLQLAPAPLVPNFDPQPEYKFHPTRKWRFDFAWPDFKVAVELEGIGNPSQKSRHTTFTGYAADCEKYNAAAELGWRVFRYTGKMLTDDPIACINQIVRVLEHERE